MENNRDGNHKGYVSEIKADKIKWIFFDMGSTLIDESVAMEHRIREVIAGTNITYEQFVQKNACPREEAERPDLTVNCLRELYEAVCRV